ARPALRQDAPRWWSRGQDAPERCGLPHTLRDRLASPQAAPGPRRAPPAPLPARRQAAPRRDGYRSSPWVVRLLAYRMRGLSTCPAPWRVTACLWRLDARTIARAHWSQAPWLSKRDNIYAYRPRLTDWAGRPRGPCPIPPDV